jgi:hypothetical protein
MALGTVFFLLIVFLAIIAWHLADLQKYHFLFATAAAGRRCDHD